MSGQLINLIPICILAAAAIALEVYHRWNRRKTVPKNQPEKQPEPADANERLRGVIQAFAEDLVNTARGRFVNELNIRLRPPDNEHEAVLSPWLQQFDAKVAELLPTIVAELLDVCIAEGICFDHVRRIRQLVNVRITAACNTLVADCMPAGGSVASATSD
ncbi:MAG TPA: hypothetical protein VNG90_03620 [Candidatus Acidoferrum sp.]|nr:hypothetical protein [Candidatus Acidoferrum sp.]